MNSGCKRGGRKQSLNSSAIPCSVHPLKESQPDELQSAAEKSLRIKRRRTRKERNYVKYGRDVTSNRAPDQRPNCRGDQKLLPPFWGSQLSSCVNQSIPIQTSKETRRGAKPVVITQNRLTQHLGMFNREVKSADIERLLSPRTEPQVVEMTPLQRGGRTERRQLEEELHQCQSYDAELEGSSRKDLGGDKEDSFPAIIPDHRTLHAESQTGVSIVDFGEQTETQISETEKTESNAVLLNEKENVPPITAVGTESYRGKSPIRQVAQDLEKLLDLKAIFPGRNLISETRQAVIDALMDQKKTLPDFSALLLLKRLVGGCNSGTTQTDFKTPQEGDYGSLLELKSACSSSSSTNRHSDQDISLKKRKGQELLFHTCPVVAPDPTIRMAEDRSSQRQDLEPFSEPEVFDPHNFYLAALHPVAHLLSAPPQRTNLTSRNSFAIEDQTVLRTTRQTLWGIQSRPEKFEKPPKKKVSKRHGLPFAPHDFLGSVNLSVVGRRSDCFPELQQCSCLSELSPEQWNFQETELSSTPISHHSQQDPHDFQFLDLGLRTTERIGSESQTSFDVLKSIWSPKMVGRGAKLSVSRALGYPCLTQPSPVSRELNPEQGQPKEFFQLYSVLPPQRCSLERQIPQQEVFPPNRHTQHGNGLFSLLAKPRTQCQKAPFEQGGTSNSYQFWGITEAPARKQGSREKGCARSGSQPCNLERLLQMEGARVFQQLPMSYFPPSEALENRHSPLYPLPGQLLGQPSPEPWAFPRMKLY